MAQKGINISPAPNWFIETIDSKLLQIACPERSLIQLDPWVKPIKKACLIYFINTLRRVAAFPSHMAHESGMIVGREENLNYSAQGLANTWPQRYSVDPKADIKIPNYKAKFLNRNPEAIANDVYASRMGNGDSKSGDGWRFRGIGPGQLTGRSNWTLFGKTVRMTAEQAVTYGKTLEGGVMSFAWYWHVNNINQLADTPGVEDETKAINGGYNGLEDRRLKFNKIVAEMLRRERISRGIVK